MKNSLFKGKSTRTKIFTVITAALCVLLLAVNLLLTYLGSERMLFADLTPEGFYTLSGKMKESCKAILEAKDEDGEYRLKNPIKVTFCDDPDNLIANVDTRMTYYMAIAIRNRYDNFEVETVNVRVNPAAVSMYKTTSLDSITPTDVIISYGSKYRVASADWWTGDYFSYNGEYQMASILASLTAISQPAVYFLTDHGETYYDPENPTSEMSLSLAHFADVLMDCGFAIKTIKISEVDKVPEDCALLIINNPTSDFTTDPDRYDEYEYVSDLEKLDRYLVRGSGSIIINKDYRLDLPKLQSFTEEWGIGFGNAQVRDPDSALGGQGSVGTDYGSSIIATYDTDEYSFGSAYYGDYASLTSAPKMIFTDTGYVFCSFDDGEVETEPGNFNIEKTYASFIGTTASAVGYEGQGSSVIKVGAGEKTLAAMSVRTNMDSNSGEYEYSYLFCTNSKDFFSNNLLGNGSYANKDILSAVVKDVSRTEQHASVDLGGLSWNSSSFGGKQTVSTTLSDKKTEVYAGDGTSVGYNLGLTETARVIYTVIVMIPAVAVLVFGITVFIKRKFL